MVKLFKIFIILVGIVLYAIPIIYILKIGFDVGALFIGGVCWTVGVLHMFLAMSIHKK